jgi:hypothetical protein
MTDAGQNSIGVADGSGFDDSSEPQQDVTEWQHAHQQLSSLALARAGLDFDEGRWLIQALRCGVHVRLGHGSFAEYVERLFGYSPRLTQDKLRVAEAIQTLPAMAHALSAGEISWSALRELTRVAAPDTERDWLNAARGGTVREIEQLVSGRHVGDHPGDARDARAVRHVLRLELSGEALATFREALAKIRRDAGQLLDDDAAMLLMARSVLGGPKDEARASYQVALTVCETCRAGKQQGRGKLVDVRPEVVAMAMCDAQHIGTTHVGRAAASPTRASQNIPPAVRRAVLRRDNGRCVFPGCRHATFLDVHHIDPRAEGGDHDPDNLMTVCSAHHRAVHRGEAHVAGNVGTGLHFRHADGTAYGGVVSPGVADAHAKAFRGLLGLGFREREARRALEQVGAHVGRDATVEVVLRSALMLLGA